MFYVMLFHDNGFGRFSLRALRTQPYKELAVAIEQLKLSGKQGYIKQQGIEKPVYQNVMTEEQVQEFLVTNSVNIPLTKGVGHEQRTSH